MEKIKLPMGIENFGEIRKGGFYYIDKTGLIKQLLKNLSKVNLFTRPRRFGKTLNMSMLKYFFEMGSDSTLFNGLEISKEKKLFDEYMGKFPVISLSLKGASGTNFEEAKAMLREMIGNEALRLEHLLQEGSLSDTEYQQYKIRLFRANRDIVALLRMCCGKSQNFSGCNFKLRRCNRILIDFIGQISYADFRKEEGTYDLRPKITKGKEGNRLVSGGAGRAVGRVKTGCQQMGK